MRSDNKKNTINQNHIFSTPALKYFRFKEERYRDILDQSKIGLHNFILVQKYPFYKWPAWIYQQIVENGESNRQAKPVVLTNNNFRDAIAFTNFLSNEELIVDSSGMISNSYSLWSLEVWLEHNNEIIRPAEYLNNVTLNRDSKNTLITIHFSKDSIGYEIVIYGTRTFIDEAVIEVEVKSPGKVKDVNVLFVIRPYNNEILGHCEKIEYQQDLKLLKINGEKKIFINNEPNFILTGNCQKGDIQKTSDEAQSIVCKDGLATLAIGYRITSKKNVFYFSVPLDTSEISEGNYEFSKIKNDYIEYTEMRLSGGLQVKISDKKFHDWMNASKISVLNTLQKDLYTQRDDVNVLDYKTIYYILHAYNLMGFTNEALKIIETAIKKVTYDQKKIKFNNITDFNYIIIAVAEYFIYNRNTDWLYNQFDQIKKIASHLLSYSSKIKKLSDIPDNSLSHLYTKDAHIFDLLLLICSLQQYAYLARSRGIFGDDIKFQKESERLVFLVNKTIMEKDELFQQHQSMYVSFGYYPFFISTLDKAVFSNLDSLNLPTYDIMNGYDIALSLILSCRFICKKNKMGYDFLHTLMKRRSKRFTFPEFINPETNRTTSGIGSSKIVASLFFSALRNMLFIDFPDRLEFFPLPEQSWFAAGKEISIVKAPSRFGEINVRLVCTKNEIHMYFDELPKYIPPDIMINLPFKCKLQNSDDFIVKRHEKNSFLINGWPEIIRFVKN